MHVVGTAGHVDHGKSTLVRWLTGIDPDRLAEEKIRQMTIDIGFAWMTLPSGQEIGFVDVPGHRDFVDNMLVGVGGIDFVLFVIAADEGVMPQTREHLSILNLLDIKSGLIVLTKVDQVNDPEWMELIEGDVKEFVRGTFLEGSPLVRVSAVSNQGRHELLEILDSMVGSSPKKPDLGRPRLPIDRVFSIKGFGTIVTGTLLDGTMKVGDRVTILPSGKTSRIRGLQTHKEKIDQAVPGSRTAINLVNIEREDIERGDVITHPGLYSPTRRIDAFIKVLRNTADAVKHDDEVKIFHGTNQQLARIRVIGKKEISPGDNGYVQIEFPQKISAYFRDKFIIRRPSPAETIGGGLILNPAAPKRYRRFSKSVQEYFKIWQTGEPEEILLYLLNQSGLLTLQELIERSGLDGVKIKESLNSLIGDKILPFRPSDNQINKNTLLISSAKWQDFIKKITRILREFHQRNPLKPGIQSEVLRNQMDINLENWNYLINRAKEKEIIKIENNIIRNFNFSLKFNEESEKKIEHVENEFNQNPYSPPSLRELEEKYGPDLIRALVNNGTLIKTSDDIAFLQSHYEEMLAFTIKKIKEKGSITLAEFRDEFESSRKYALSFLEYLDMMSVTIRRGDERILSGSKN